MRLPIFETRQDAIAAYWFGRLRLIRAQHGQEVTRAYGNSAPAAGKLPAWDPTNHHIGRLFGGGALTCALKRNGGSELARVMLSR
jgi:hypothetical protein